MKVFLSNLSNSVTAQIFDYYHAYRQALSIDLSSDFNIVEDRANADKSVALISIEQTCNIKSLNHDLIFIDNYGESLEVCSVAAAGFLQQPNVYLVCGSYVADNHLLYDKIIPYNHNHQSFVDNITRRFFPQYHQLRADPVQRTKDLIFINGANRAWRSYFLRLLEQKLSSRLPIKNSVNSAPSKIIDCQFESAEDTAFKEFCNINLPIVDDQHEVDMSYYDNSLSVGHNGKFGLIPPGYFFIPEYFEYHSVIYPETSYINDTLFVTEKTWKCFAAQCIPWPIAGAGFNQMLNDFGYSTAWNLLPRHLQTFDNVKDHVERYHLQIDAVEWASRNAHIWSSDQARQLRHTNLINLIYNSTWDTRTFQQLDRLLT